MARTNLLLVLLLVTLTSAALPYGIYFKKELLRKKRTNSNEIKRSMGTALLGPYIVYKPANSLGQEFTQTFTSKTEKIMIVRALDRNTDKLGSKVEVVSGGPGHNYVTLKFISKPKCGIKYSIELVVEDNSVGDDNYYP